MFFSQYFSFPVSVSFHHCSILIHSSTTHCIMFFSQYFGFSLSLWIHQCPILIHFFTNWFIHSSSPLQNLGHGWTYYTPHLKLHKMWSRLRNSWKSCCQTLPLHPVPDTTLPLLTPKKPVTSYLRHTTQSLIRLPVKVIHNYVHLYPSESTQYMLALFLAWRRSLTLSVERDYL